MSDRTRDWLREFLDLGARAAKEGIPEADIERQEDTVVRALDLLDEQPGIVLADEVGMGKTYEALGIAAAFRRQNPRSRIVIITPGPDLNTKWANEFPRFQEMFDFGDNISCVHSLADFIEKTKKRRIVIAPVTMFQSGKRADDQVYLLSLYFYWKGLHGNTANAIMARFGEGDYQRIDVLDEKFLGAFDLDSIAPFLKSAFRRGNGTGRSGLDDLYERDGIAAFEDASAIDNALYRARFMLTNKLMPKVALLIVDEAHKLKNPDSLRTRAMHQVFWKRFDKAVFLTATPFQLDVNELREILDLFNGAKSAPTTLLEDIKTLLAFVQAYQSQYDEFQCTWSALDPTQAAQFRRLYDDDPEALPEITDPNLKKVLDQINALRCLKRKEIEPGFRRWMIRSLREDKRTYRNSQKIDIPVNNSGALPFLIYERFIAELFRRHQQTHKAAAEINMVSSYKAAQSGTILTEDYSVPPEAAGYHNLLRDILTALDEMGTDNCQHPKVQNVITEAIEAAERGEKTLIFCARTATLAELRRDLDQRWNSRIVDLWRRVYPEITWEEISDTYTDDQSRQRGRHSLLQARFHRTNDTLYLTLRENYLQTIPSLRPATDWARKRLPGVTERANSLLREVRVGKTSAERVDYQVAKRCVEQSVAQLWADSNGERIADDTAADALLDPAFIKLGLDLSLDGHENDPVGDETPQWTVTEVIVERIICSPNSLWGHFAEPLQQLPNALRTRIVEQLARYLTYKQVAFIPELLIQARDSGLATTPVESAALSAHFPHFWDSTPGRRWIAQLGNFLDYVLHRNPDQQRDILDGPIRTGDFARHTVDGERRERLREAFNTPLYPMVLIANEVMQEGLDLHKHCRRIVHHDLAWNPARIEQRIGRIDRLGSLTSRLRSIDHKTTLDILYPLIQSTIDERLYHTVRTREKWLEFLLGAPPNFEEYSFSDERPEPLPEKLSQDLTISLAPKRAH